MQALIEAREVSKAFAGRNVVERVSLAVPPGKIVTLIGPNGCGKTTLLRLLLGLEQPDSGIVVRKSGLKIGYMPQAFAVEAAMPLSVGALLALYAGASPAREVARELDVERLWNQPLQALSGGETQRVMLARALLNRPELLVLDEPVQGVDVSGQAELYALIANVRKTRDVAVLMVSHDLHFVMSATDEVVCLNHHICCAGHPHHVQNDPSFAALFGEPLARSLAVYTHHHDHSHH